MQKMSLEGKVSNIDLKLKFSKALENKYFSQIVKSIDLPRDVIMKYTSSLMDAALEFENCSKCKGIESCPNLISGNLMKADKLGNGIVFSYVKCRLLSKDNYKDNVTNFDLPKNIKNASMKDVYKDDKPRIELIKKMKEFKDAYLNNESPKGLYIYGNFGSGKSYLTAALFNDLAQKNIKSVIVHVPELLRSIKDSFDKDYSDIFDEVMTSPLLLLDDIGAEYLTPWARDEVIEPILQYRMDQDLPTFFTSNYDLNDLEKHFIVNDDKMKAKRIMERIRQVSIPVELVGKNRRK